MWQHRFHIKISESRMTWYCAKHYQFRYFGHFCSLLGTKTLPYFYLLQEAHSLDLVENM